MIMLALTIPNSAAPRSTSRNSYRSPAGVGAIFIGSCMSERIDLFIEHRGGLRVDKKELGTMAIVKRRVTLK